MTTRIDTLTDAQKAAMPAHARKWIDIGQSCQPANRPAFEAALADAYRHANLAWHGNVIWVESPIVGAFAAPIARHIIDRDAVDDAVGDAVRVAVGVAVVGAVTDAVRGAVDGAVHGAVHDAVHDAVRGAVGDAIDGAVDGAVDDAVDGAVDGAVRGAVRGAVVGAVDGAVRVAVRGAVVGAVDGAVRGAVRGAVDDGWYRYTGGWWWASWMSWRTYFTDECDLQLSPDITARLDTARTLTETGSWFWPHTDFAIACDRPTTIHLERVAPDGWSSHRLHNPDGPSIQWRDGWALHHWHGQQVPAWVIDDPTPKRIAAEPNAEIRRCAIESFGWDRYITAAQLDLVGEAPDPGNPGKQLALYDVPRGTWDGNIRVLLVTNGSPDRNGQVRRYGLTVPATCTDPISAAAWTYDLTAAEYAGLTRRT